MDLIDFFASLADPICIILMDWIGMYAVLGGKLVLLMVDLNEFASGDCELCVHPLKLEFSYGECSKLFLLNTDLSYPALLMLTKHQCTLSDSRSGQCRPEKH